jgi:hypothetical protein
MPYIPQEQRDRLDPLIAPLSKDLLEHLDVGEYNYVMTKLMHEFILKKGIKYENFCVAKGVLADARDEISRIPMGFYEDTKIRANGFISELDLHLRRSNGDAKI